VVGNVHVVGTGLITAIGNSSNESLASLKSQTSGIGSLSIFDSVHKDLPVGEVKFTNEVLAAKLKVSSDLPRTCLLGIHAAREAILNAGISDLGKWKTGLISATTVGGMDKTENFFSDYLQDQSRGRLRDVVHHSCGSTTDVIARDLKINRFVTTINTACSSSVNSIILATRLIKAGVLDVVVAGGADALTKFTLNGFNSLMILDKQRCRPFDANRSGLNLGEGAGFLILASDDVIREEKMNSLCAIAGYGNANDAYHQTASSPEGRGSFNAMSSALKMSGLSPESIDYVNLHGTGTVSNDLSEGTAVKRLFGENYPKVSSTKSFTGHTLGASGGIEAAISVLAISEQCIFPNLGFETPIHELNIVPQKMFESASVKHVMSNSFGFGGNCSSILISKTA
jgi:3-oxoacyl-[acyl-carrier-protein] synthase-1